MNPTLIIIVMLFIILVSIQYTLNKILVELRQIRKQKEHDRKPWDR